MPLDPTELYARFHDHPTFAAESLSIANESGVIVPMHLNTAPLKLNEGIERQRKAGKPIRIVYLKARRVQVSSGTAAQFFQHTAFYGGQHCLVVAHNEPTALEILNFYQNFEKYYKPFGGVIRLHNRKKASEGWMEWENGSWIRVATAKNLDLGRGFNIRRLQLDEYASYLHAKELMTSVMAAVPKDADTMVVVPSTAKGVGNDFHKLWLQATDTTSKFSEWLAIFCAWWEHPTNVWPLEIAPERFQFSLDEEEREMKGRYNLTLPQLNWRRWVIANDLQGDAIRFRQEHPGNPEEAFLTSGRNRFDVQSISRMPVQREAVQGGLEQNTIGIEKRIVFLPRERGELTIFRKPQPGRFFVVGADASEGIDVNEGRGEVDSDFSVGQVLDRDTGEQVAILRARLHPSAFGEYLFHLGNYYNGAGIVPEVNSMGMGVVDELLRLGYPPHLLYHRRRAPDQDPNERADNIGWKTTTVTRPQLLSKLDTALRELAIAVHDPVTIQELMTFVIKANGKAEAQGGCHDDTVLALALAVVGIVELPRIVPAHAKQRREERDSGSRGRILKLLR